ncbi:sigma-70 family RNA polymerase sigma factor [Tundrisphaera lichenicola]|uniref:sigma-70 family RNA polymerase sigma factor n=1 Tax=Tundrisphaera lichenicola TaxID=2029860 RepID=UPI003EBD58E7
MIKFPASCGPNLDSILRIGAAGSLGDGELLDPVARSSGESAEVAFSALIERHGSMVYRVCLDIVGNRHDAEDAYQAVLLVLARRAGSVRHRDSAAGWLLGVERRVSARAQLDLARRREHERRRAEQGLQPAEGSAPVHDWSALYEEIDRLPEKYRAAIVVCHLEGMSHEQAANLLQCPIRTLQSRLLRARARLRDRLARRDLVPESWTLEKPSRSVAPKSLAIATTRLALSHASGSLSGGSVPSAVASLAEGVLAMTTLAKFKLVLAASITLGLATGLAWASGLGGGGEPVVATIPADDPVIKTEAKGRIVEEKKTKEAVEARGVVVDEAGRPVPGAEVVAQAYTERESRGVTDAEGAFRFPLVRAQRIDATSLLARSADGDRLGSFLYEYNLTPEQASVPARIVLKTARRFTARVEDARHSPISGATVEVVGNFQILGHGSTGPDGVAELAVPPEASIEWVIALKSGRGLDYAEFGTADEHGRSRGGRAASKLPATVALVLEGARTAKIRAVDAEGKPLAGVGFGPWLIQKEGRRSQLNLGDYRSMTASTDNDGVAAFDWLPPSQKGLTFWPRSDDFAHRRVIVEAGATEPVTATMTRKEMIRGRVVHSDGSPASGIMVETYGTGRGHDHGQDRTRSDADGSYELTVSPGEAYAVYVQDDNWAAPSRLDVIVLPDHSVKNVDFKLTRGTIIRGKVTVGSDDKPVAGQYMRLDESTGEQAPAEVRDEGDHVWREVRRQFGELTDAEGRYSIRVGPGTYTLFGPPHLENEKFTVKDEPELIRDFRMPRPEKGPISGRVVEAVSGKGVAGAKIDFVAANNRGVPRAVFADGEGHFQFERDLDKLVVCVKSADGSLGAIVEVGAEDPEVVIPISPTATATGLLLDEQGKPAANQPLEWGRRVYLDEEEQISMTCFAPKVVTDAEGRFILPSLVVGQEYNISVQRDNMYLAAGVVRPESPSPIDLRTLKIGAYRPKPTAEEMSSFRKGGPEAGDMAPPIEGTFLDGRPLKLEDFRGKFVLLDFWATWCGPCIGEIPQLQAVHDAFREDGRFVILSLSVDEKIDEPRAFQEKRKLPWSQGFLGEGIHSATPGSFGVRAIPAFVLVGPDGRIVKKGMRGKEIEAAVAEALGSAR